MDSFIPMGGFQMPFQRRLSRLYNDTKKSSDFVKEPVQSAEDPEIKALHRKLRIQKDRLVSWGLEWSDPSQSAEILIDSSLSKAGLSEVVGSIMSTIKDILAEAEPLWHSSRKMAGSEKAFESEKSSSRDTKMIPRVTWDKGRFEDLVRDLTTSIDTLYDLSRTRSSYAQTSDDARRRLFKSTSSTEDLRAFESSRIQTPRQIDPRTLTNLRSIQAEPMAELPRNEHPREVVFMDRVAFAQLADQSSLPRQPYSPLLLEYASFDPIYSITGIMPPMTRFEKLSSGLQAETHRSPGSWTGLPRLLGYFEDMERSRFGLVYLFPATFNPVSFEHLTQNPLYNLCSLADLLARPDFEPKLEAKFRLASNLANTVFDLHARGVTHSNLVDSNVSFCNAVGTDPEVSSISTGEVDIRRPLVSAFDLFSEPPTQATAASEPPSSSFSSLYKHPLDPRTTTQSPLAASADSKTFDLYSLAMLLLSIGLWAKLDNLVPDPSQPSIPESLLDQLAIRCGTLYSKAVQTCWSAVDQEMTGQLTSDQVVARAQLRASRYLEACCILDGVSNLEERLSNDLGETRAQPARPGPSADTKLEKEKASVEAVSEPQQPARRSGKEKEKEMEMERESRSQLTTQRTPDTQIKGNATVHRKRSSKTRLYPHVPLPPEMIEQWNAVVMPQINMALDRFYRKHPESVEISLESIGESPQQTQPTVLVVCNSVNKVRAILKRNLGVLFDGTTGFALKVCRGQVLRSRNLGASRRSMAKGAIVREDGNGSGEDSGSGGLGDVIAANPDFQERPQNGASIGAWIGDRHLPPVSFGGLIMVDEKPFGMTVHHMLDDPDEDREPRDTEGAPRSMARQQEEQVMDLAAWYAKRYQGSDSEGDDNHNSSGGSSSSSSVTDEFACEFSDTDSDAFSESAITTTEEGSEADDGDNSDDDLREPGDVPGIRPGRGTGYVVTQPALDDVEDGFYPCPDTRDEDHLDTYGLGEVYASSGIRRRPDDGLVHEVDWALFRFFDDRLPGDNVIPRAAGLLAPPPTSSDDSGAGAAGADAGLTQSQPNLHPTAVASASSLPGLEVQCIARTSGLQTGVVLPTLSSVKIYGRASPSHTYQISGTPSHLAEAQQQQGGGGETRRKKKKKNKKTRAAPLPMGVPGDSGAWIVERRQGHLCGHVLAWSDRKRVAYICPMEVLLKDIAETLDACEVRLPGGEVVVTGPAAAYERPASRVSELSDVVAMGASLHGWRPDEGDRGNAAALGVALRAAEGPYGGEREGSRWEDEAVLEGEEYFDEGVEMHLGEEIKQLRVTDENIRETSTQA